MYKVTYIARTYPSIDPHRGIPKFDMKQAFAESAQSFKLFGAFMSRISEDKWDRLVFMLAL